jgi:hypothetical protein
VVRTRHQRPLAEGSGSSKTIIKPRVLAGLWRTDSTIKLNRFWLMHYVTEKAFAENDAYAAKHPDIPINTKTATVWFDDIVIARSYIGPICSGTGTDTGGVANFPDKK